MPHDLGCGGGHGHRESAARTPALGGRAAASARACWARRPAAALARSAQAFWLEKVLAEEHEGDCKHPHQVQLREEDIYFLYGQTRHDVVNGHSGKPRSRESQRSLVLR